MPIYEYECGHCRSRFELKQGFDEEPEVTCPECQGKVRRIFHPTPIIFKGSGFYITDSRKGSAPDLSKSSKKTAPKEGK